MPGTSVERFNASGKAGLKTVKLTQVPAALGLLFEPASLVYESYYI
jgi:hypothetical protein